AGPRKDSTGDACVICLSDITERAITAPCNHCAFDFLCLVSWLQQRSTCPLCKAAVSVVQYDWRSPTDFKSYSVRPTQLPRERASRPSIASQHPRHGLPRRPRSLRRPGTASSPDVALLRRRYVYRRKLFSLHVGTTRLSGYRDLTPQMIATSPDLQSRARMWIRRELRVFSFLDPDPGNTPSEGGATTSSNAEFLLSYTVSILNAIDIKSSDGKAEELLQEFLGRDHARLFLHELNGWLRSPYTKLEDWDKHVQYKERL
ncbi:hypothetical protein BDV96DRAFT_451280, partial [Lophiotrema nucula]